MIVSDAHQFVFMHIPKCGGTAVRSALEQFDERADIYFNRARDAHGTLGELDYRHIPLSILRDHFTDDFRCVARYQAFAVMRDPFERFPSAVFQRIRTKLPVDPATDAIHREVDAIMAQLSARFFATPVTDPDLIHFTRQCDYIYCDGQKLVDHIYLLADVASLVAAVSELSGTAIAPPQRENERLRYSNKALAAADRWVQTRVMNTLPRRIWKPVFSIVKGGLSRTGVLRRENDWYSGVFERPDVQNFIARFYAQDIETFDQLSAIKDG